MTSEAYLTHCCHIFFENPGLFMQFFGEKDLVVRSTFYRHASNLQSNIKYLVRSENVSQRIIVPLQSKTFVQYCIVPVNAVMFSRFLLSQQSILIFLRLFALQFDISVFIFHRQWYRQRGGEMFI